MNRYLLCLIYIFFFNLSYAYSQTESEPNDTFENANLIMVNTEITGSISQTRSDDSVDNLDWYRFTLPKDGRVRIRTSRVSGTRDFQFWLIGADENRRTILSTETNLPNPSVREVWLTAGEYFLNFNGRGSRVGRTYEFMLEHTAAPDVDVDEEFNDTFDTASALPLNATHTGHISFVRPDNSADNLDWYRFTLPKDGRVRIRTSRVSGTRDFQFWLIGADENRRTILSTETNLPNPSVREVWLTAGEYFLNFNGRGSRVGRTYEFMLEHTAAPDVDVDEEFNDTFDTASALPLNATHTGHISFVRPDNSADNLDWYQFTLANDDEVTIRFTHEPDDFGIQYFILPLNEPNNIFFGTETNLPPVTERRTQLSAGSYYFQVFGRGNRTGRTYRFSINSPNTNIKNWDVY